VTAPADAPISFTIERDRLPIAAPAVMAAPAKKHAAGPTTYPAIDPPLARCLADRTFPHVLQNRRENFDHHTCYAIALSVRFDLFGGKLGIPHWSSSPNLSADQKRIGVRGVLAPLGQSRQTQFQKAPHHHSN
jgi:hypothetical protein